MITERKLNEVLSRIAYKLGEDHGLKQQDFVIRWQPWKKHAFRIRKLGVGLGIYWDTPFDHPDFENILRRALSGVRNILDKKGGKIATLQDLERWSKASVDRNWLELPKLLPREMFEVEEVYSVVVKHRVTGLIVERSNKRPCFGKMILEARLELSEMVGAVERAASQNQVLIELQAQADVSDSREAPAIPNNDDEGIES